MSNPVPKMLPGEVHEQRVRCGRGGCKCARGEPHRAYYRFWTQGGRRHKAYVRRADLEATREACRRWAEADAAVAAIVDTPEGDRVRAESRRMLREAMGGQSDSPAGRRQLRRLRARCPGRRPDDAPDRLAGCLSGLELKMFRF